MDGFVLDYVNTFRSEMGRLPEYDELGPRAGPRPDHGNRPAGPRRSSRPYRPDLAGNRPGVTFIRTG
jgi:hypothetical protein